MWELYPHVHGRGICKDDPYVKKFCIPLLRKTLVSKIDLKQDPLSLWARVEGQPYHSPHVLQWIQRLIDPSHDHHYMVCWSPPPTGFQGLMLNLYRGIKWKPCIKTRCRWIMKACLGRLHVGILSMLSWSGIMRSWPLCEKIGHSLIEKNPSFQNWPIKWSLIHGPRVESHP